MFLDKTECQTHLDLSLYIEGLLNTETVEVEQEVKPEVKPETMLLNDLLTPEVEELVIETEAKAEMQIKTQAETIPVEPVKTVSEEKLEEKVFDSSIPAWGQQAFKCLTVKLDGMNLMIPAMSVSYVEFINKKILRLPLEVEAFRGIVTLRERSVAVIDLHKLISKNGVSYNQSEKNVEECHVEYVIVMEDGSYALACDEVGEMVELRPEDIRWHKASFNNPLFAGVVADELCAIVNIDKVQQQVEAMPFVQSLNSNYLEQSGSN
ncbi:MAG: chemotaxis protein CheW [Gammaproteobacteria bacterium]|jgi:purine-binding chemotaxis protein CheW